MATLQGTDIADLVQSVINDKGRMKMTDISSDYNETIVAKELFSKSKSEPGFGTEFEFNLVTDDNGSAEAHGLYAPVQVNPTNVMTSGKMPWRRVRFNYGIDHDEIAMNMAPTKVYALIDTRRRAALASWIKFAERRFWRLASASDTLNFQGIPYWIVKSATAITTNNGFNGTVPSGYTTVANINPTTYPRYTNFAGPYSALTDDDFVKTLETAMDRTRFVPLVEGTPTYNTGDKYGLYTTFNVRSAMKDILKAQNDSLGWDLDPANGKVAFRRSPLVWVNELDSDTTGPIYGINWGVFSVRRLKNVWMREVVIKEHDTQPTVTAVHTFCSFNTFCPDRRRNFVLSNGTTLPE
jgi:hypothetical protein